MFQSCNCICKLICSSSILSLCILLQCKDIMHSVNINLRESSHVPHVTEFCFVNWKRDIKLILNHCQYHVTLLLPLSLSVIVLLVSLTIIVTIIINITMTLEMLVLIFLIALMASLVLSLLSAVDSFLKILILLLFITLETPNNICVKIPSHIYSYCNIKRGTVGIQI